MGLNIKNERVHALAREAAVMAGTTQTGAIEEALQRYLAEMGAERSRERMRQQVTATLRRIHASMTDEDRELLRTAEEEMYDEYGLPR